MSAGERTIPGRAEYMPIRVPGELSPDDQATLECLEVCTSTGWMPEPQQVKRLIALRQAVRNGVRREDGFNLARLRYARWLREHGLLSDG